MLIPSPLSTSQHTAWIPCMGIPSPSRGPLTQSLHHCIPLKQAGFLGKLLTGKSGVEAKKPQSNDISLIVFPSLSRLARGFRAKWCALSQRQGQDRKIRASLLPKSRGTQDHCEGRAGCSSKGVIRSRNKGEKRGQLPRSRLGTERKQGKPAWR